MFCWKTQAVYTNVSHVLLLHGKHILSLRRLEGEEGKFREQESSVIGKIAENENWQHDDSWSLEIRKRVFETVMRTTNSMKFVLAE